MTAAAVPLIPRPDLLGTKDLVTGAMPGSYNNSYLDYSPYYHPQYGAAAAPAVPQAEAFTSGFPQYVPTSSEHSSQPPTPADEHANGFAPASSAGYSPTKVRRRMGAAGEHVKHRRTRSGCFNCRSRRVKCDETRPICERCKKGNRECVYPDANAASKSTSRDSKSSRPSQVDSPSSPSGDDTQTGVKDDGMDDMSNDYVANLRFIKRSSTDRPTASRKNSSTPSIPQAISPTSSTGESFIKGLQAGESSATLSSHRPSRSQPDISWTAQQKTWNELPQEIRFYLEFYRTHIDNCHYWFKFDFDNFLHTTFIEIAMGYQPLLYAIVGFAAYHYSLTRREGSIQDFLGYYNKSVTLLRFSLTKQEAPNIATLMTILQLATIEEFLGDWVSLLKHQKAAHQIFTSMYTPQTIMQTETSRKMLDWYLRFDLVGAMISGNGTFLPREWYEARHDYHITISQKEPTSLVALYKVCFSENGLICADAANLWARNSRDQVSEDEFNERADDLLARLTGYETRFPSLLLDSSKFISDFSGASPRDADDIVDPYDTQFLYGDPIWSSNLMLLDWWSLELMFKHQLASIRREPPPAEADDIALKILKMFEAVELYPNKPRGTLVAAQASLAGACLFVPKDQKYSLWVRKKLAAVETSGFIYPRTFRQRLSEHWNVDLSHWWLPNDESYPPNLRAIRNLACDRIEGIEPDQMSEDMRDMRGVFNNLSLDESASLRSPIGMNKKDKGKRTTF